MDINIQPGQYVVAVSGGVDSMALLHMLAQLPPEDYRFTVAHFDHGIRIDTAADRQLVSKVSKAYGLPFVYDEGNLGANTSEAAARQARYAFLHAVRRATKAQAVITAHHQDDALETAILNLQRGTGRKGITSLQSTDVVKRPLLQVPKTELYNYARAHRLAWREDSTNTDTRYARNRVRHVLAPRLTMAQRQRFIDHIETMRTLNTHIDDMLASYLREQPNSRILRKKYLVQLPHAVGLELFALWLRENTIRSFDKKGLLRMFVQAKTLQHGQRIDVNAQYFIVVEKTKLVLTDRA